MTYTLMGYIIYLKITEQGKEKKLRKRKQGEDRMEQYTVTGMSCAACSSRVEKAVSKVPGVTSCSVSLLTNSMGVEGTASAQDIIHAVVSHGYGITVECGVTLDVEPVHEMEKVLFAADELTGLIWAAALMRPSKSTKDMELKSLKKKYKSKGFAAGCSREVIERGAEQLGWPLEKLLTMTLQAMADSEDEINRELEAETAQLYAKR